MEYPPVDRGLPAIAVAEVIAPHAEWMKRLRYAYGAEAATFERDIGGVVERYAHYVHLLPATPDSHFRHAGGLFRMGLEIGFYALQATDGAIFSGRQTITQRSALEPRWRYATFLAGLCSELYRMSHVTVTNDRGEEWPAYLQPLGDLAAATRAAAAITCAGSRIPRTPARWAWWRCRTSSRRRSCTTSPRATPW